MHKLYYEQSSNVHIAPQVLGTIWNALFLQNL